jgi:hypothetical protein
MQMSYFQNATFSTTNLQTIDATVDALTFSNVLDVCDNTVAPDTTSVKYYVMWDVNFDDLFEVTNRSILKDSIIPISSHTLSGVISSDATLNVKHMIDKTSSSSRANTLKDYITSDPSNVTATVNQHMNLPALPKQTLSLYTSIPYFPNTSNEFELEIPSTDPFNNFREGMYVTLSLENWKLDIERLSTDTLNEKSGITKDTLKEFIKLSNGLSIDNNLLEFAFLIKQDFSFNRTSDKISSSILQEHYEYSSGLYNVHKYIDNINDRALDINQFQPRIYHLGSQEIVNSVNISKTNWSDGLKRSDVSELKLGDGSVNTIHYLLKVVPSSAQYQIRYANLNPTAVQQK